MYHCVSQWRNKKHIGFRIPNKWQILKQFARSFHQSWFFNFRRIIYYTTTYTSSAKFFKAIILEVVLLVSLCHAYFGICCWGIGQKMPRIFGSLVDHSWWDGKLHGCKRPNEKSRHIQVQGRISNHHHQHKNRIFWVQKNLKPKIAAWPIPM